MKTLKRHLTVANVLSCIALFVALGTSAVAAMKLGPNQVKSYNIAKQAVTNPKIKSQAVTSGKIKNLGINSADLGKNSVVNSKIAKKAVTNDKLGTEAVGSNKLGKNSVITGKLGPEAVAAGKIANEAVTSSKLAASFYSQLVRNVAYVTETSASSSEGTKEINAECPAGKEVLGGGIRINGDTEGKVVAFDSGPLLSGSARIGWTAAAREIEAGTGLSWSITAFAICAEI